MVLIVANATLTTTNSQPSHATGCGAIASNPSTMVALSTTRVARAWARWVGLPAMNAALIDRPTTISPVNAAAAVATVKKNSVHGSGSEGMYIVRSIRLPQTQIATHRFPD